MRNVEQWILQDPGRRGVSALMVPGDLEGAAAALAGAHKVLIMTGFPVGPSAVAETDGPPGAIFLGRALARLGKEVVIATHNNCEPVLNAGLRAVALAAPLTALASGAQLAPLAALPPGAQLVPLEVLTPGTDPTPILTRHAPDLVVAVELPGRAADGEYYSMRGMLITGRVSPLDGLLLLAAQRSIPTIGVGDGGNEAGMGKVRERVMAEIVRGEQIACVIPADYLIAAGTSNWGCYGLLAAIDPNLVPTAAEEVALLTALNAAGALDAVRMEAAASVDGIDPDIYLQMLEDLRGEESREEPA